MSPVALTLPVIVRSPVCVAVMNPVSLVSSDTDVGTEADVMNPVLFVS